MCDVLETLGYLDDDEVTDRGRPLRRIYTELDLVVAECAAARASGTGSTRRSWPPPCRRWSSRRDAPTTPSRPAMPRGRVARRSRTWCRSGPTWTGVEREHRLEFLREPDLGFAWAAYRWAEGDDLDDVLGETDLAAGDFVRWIKQLLDLAGQVADAAAADPRPASTELRETARLTIGALRRGVVAYSSLTE